MKFNKTIKENKQRRIIAAFVIIVLVILLLLLKKTVFDGKPTLTVSNVRAAGIESVVTADVSINHFGDSLYPAASFVIEFDKARLELLAVKEGNVIIFSENEEIVPEWSVNTFKANETGEIRIMYLDITGGTRAFKKGQESDGVLFRLEFRVRGSAKEGESYALTVNDAVFAANDEDDSLASKSGTLKIKDGSVIIEANGK